MFDWDRGMLAHLVELITQASDLVLLALNFRRALRRCLSLSLGRTSRKGLTLENIQVASTYFPILPLLLFHHSADLLGFLLTFQIASNF